jgi:hypothetical protein
MALTAYPTNKVRMIPMGAKARYKTPYRINCRAFT